MADAAPGPPFSASFKVDLDDYVAATRLLRRRPIVGGLLFAAVAVGIGVVTVLITDAIEAGVLAVIAGLIGLVVFGTGFLERRTAAREARAFLGMPIDVQIDLAGVESTGASGSSRVPWSALTHVVANERIIVLMRDQVSMAWLPTSAFSSVAEARAALMFMRAQVEGTET